MARSTLVSRKKVSGGILKSVTKRSSNIASKATLTKVANKKVKIKRVRGGNTKRTLLTVNKVNVFDGKKSQVTEITSIVENLANRNYVKRGILTKGAVVETKLGKVKITSRPGQEGSVNGIKL